MSDLSRYLRPMPPRGFLMFGAAAVLACLICWLGTKVLASHEALLLLQQKETSLRVALAAKPAPTMSRAEKDDQQRWNALAVERGFDWKPLFAALEAVGNPDIELLEFQPDKSGQTVLLRGEAKDTNSLIAFVDELATQPAFMRVHLTHQKMKRRDRLVTVVFEVKAGIQTKK